MNLRFFVVLAFLFHSMGSLSVWAQVQPDQRLCLDGGQALWAAAEDTSGLMLNAQHQIELQAGVSVATLTLAPIEAEAPFDELLPSWNGSAPAQQASSFKVQMRFEYQGVWREWVTVGFWDKDIWSNYGPTVFEGGEVLIDVVETEELVQAYQFRVLFERKSPNYASPRLTSLCAFLSHSARTASVDYSALLADKPSKLLVDTKHIYQYAVDKEIGPSICSPATVSMIVRSYGLEADPYTFALRNKDPYWGIYGVWPRSVQHAAEYGLHGYVGRYRTWSEAAAVLAAGGRIALSIGKPLYSGHLVMLAGFDSNGRPLVHDPARADGYAYRHVTSELNQAWFGKGGVAYTFGYTPPTSLAVQALRGQISLRAMPNPFRQQATVLVQVPQTDQVRLAVYDAQGNQAALLHQGALAAGEHRFAFYPKQAAGLWLVVLSHSGGQTALRMLGLSD